MNPILNVNAKYYHLPDESNLPSSPLARAFHHVKEAAKEENVRTGTLKTLKAALHLHEVLLNADHKDIRAGIGFAADVVKVFNLPANISKLIEERTKGKFKTFSNLLDVIVGALTILKVGQYLSPTTFAFVSKGVGTVSVFGKEAVKVVSVSNVLTVLDIIRSSVSIHSSRRDIRAEKTKKMKYSKKAETWAKIREDGRVSREFIANKEGISRIKLAKAEEATTSAETAMTKALKKYNKRVAVHVDLLTELENCKPSEKFRLKCATYGAYTRVRRARKVWEKSVTKHTNEKAKLNKYQEASVNWRSFEDKIKEINQPVESVKKLADIKVAKWDRKTLKSNQGIRDSKISIGINTVGIIVMIASLALTILALSALPFVSIPLTVAFILLAGVGVGFVIWKKVRKDITYKPVPISMIWERLGAVPQLAQA